MTYRLPVPFFVFLLLILGSGIGAVAQEVTAEAAVDSPDTAEADTAEADADLSVIERWQAAPDTVFDAAEIDLPALQYVARPLIVIADSPNDPLVADQLGLISDRVSELIARDVIIVLDTDPEAATSVRAQLRPRGFSMILIAKDGSIALRKPAPWAVREIVHTIDRLTIRQQEMRGG